MFHITEKTIVYMVCPAYNKTGGTELAHQLVYELNQLGLKAYITYHGGYIDEGLYLNPAFEQYVSTYKLLNDITDEKDNVLILPEISTGVAKEFSNIQLAIWWMSVDNFLKNNHFKESYEYFGIVHAMKRLIKRDVSLTPPKIDNSRANLYQSEYAKQFLLQNGITNMHRLSDYINSVYFENYEPVARRNAVLYNPRKGMKFTQKLINASKGKLDWIPIQNMSTEEVRGLLRTSKVYIDFGRHPGKDRFPREAAMSGCCVITGKRGAAGYYEDVSIPDEYKFSENANDIERIVDKLVYCIDNYDTCSKDFDEYRNRISVEYDTFKRDVEDIFK